MINLENTEPSLTRIFTLEKTRRIIIFVSLAGIIICAIPLLPMVQNALFSIARGRLSGIEDRLRSLLSLSTLGLSGFLFLLCCAFSEKITTIFCETKNDKSIAGIFYILAALVLIFITKVSYTDGYRWLNDDNSAEMMLGHLLAEENTLVSGNWHYSTELRLIYQTLWTMPLFKLLGRFENWALIRALNILLNNIVLVLSYIFMMRQMKIDGKKIEEKWIALTSLFLLLPFYFDYWGIVTFGGYYVFFIAQLFCCLGVYLKLVFDLPNEQKTGLSRNVFFALFCLLSFLLGVQGIRALINIQIPLFIASALYYRFDQTRKNPKTVIYGLYSLTLCLFGFVVSYALQFKFSFHSFDKVSLDVLGTSFFARLGLIITSIFNYFGYAPGYSFISARGVFGIAALAFVVFLVMLLRTFSKNQFLAMFISAAALFGVFVFQFSDTEITGRYFIPFCVLWAALVAIFFQSLFTAGKTHSPLARCAVFVLVLLFIANQAFLTFGSFFSWDANKDRRGHIAFLSTHNMEFGFATVWNAKIITELTNGKIDVMGLGPDGSLSVEKGENVKKFDWLHPISWERSDYYKGKSFLVLTRDEWNVHKDEERFSGRKPDYEDDHFVVLLFPSAEAIHSEILDK